MLNSPGNHGRSIGLSVGATNLAGTRDGHAAVLRPAELTRHGHRLTGFVDRVGDPVPLLAPDGATYRSERLLADALAAMADAITDGLPVTDAAVTVPAHWRPSIADILRRNLRGKLPVVSDATAALTALRNNPGQPTRGVIVLCDFGGSGTSITLADAASDFTPIADTLRYEDFSGDLVDQALMVHALDSAGREIAVDPASTAVVGQFAGLRHECQLAKERLSTDKTTELALELPGLRTRLQVSRAELDGLIDGRLDDLFAAFDDMLRRNKIRSKDLAAVAMSGGTAKIPFVAQRLSAHTKTAVITATQPALATAVGAVKLSARQPIAQRDAEREETTMSALVGASTGGLAVTTGALPTTGRFNAPTDAMGTSTGAFAASTGTFDIPTAGALFDDPSERLTELAWSQADDLDDEPVAYTGEPYDIDDRATPSQLMQLQRADPIDPLRPRGTRLPQVFLGLAALVSMVAIGGVAFTLTSSNRAPTLPSSSTPAPPPPLSSQLPSSSLVPPPPPPSSEAPPPPPPTEAASPPPAPAPAPAPVPTYEPPPPPRTTAQATTTTVPQPTTTTPQAISTTPSTTPPPPPAPPTSTAPAMTTTYLNLPFVPVPIPVQVPEGQGGASQQQPQNPYQNPYQQSPYQQNPYQQSPYMPQNPYAGPGYGY